MPVGNRPGSRPQGIFVDVLEAIARKEGWAIEYVTGTFAEGLTRLDSGRERCSGSAWSRTACRQRRPQS